MPIAGGRDLAHLRVDDERVGRRVDAAHRIEARGHVRRRLHAALVPVRERPSFWGVANQG